MQYSKTTLMELSHRYSKILKKCALLNAIILMGAMVALPVMAETTYDGGYYLDKDEIYNAQNKNGLDFSSEKASNRPNNTAFGGYTFVNRGATLTVKDSTYSNLTFDGSGTVFSNRVPNATEGTATLNISGTTFTNNHSYGDGGAIANFNVLKISNSKFEGNTAQFNLDDLSQARTDDTQPVGGGAIALGSVSDTDIATITNTEFLNNKSGRNGGAIGTRLGKDGDNSAAKLNIAATFIGNSAQEAGGAIYNTFYANNTLGLGNGVTVTGNFTNNSAGTDGGAIYNDGAKDNEGKGNYGGVMTISNSQFSNNIANINGGAIYNSENATLTLAGTNVFSGNTAAGKANDIHNLGELNISGNLTLDGGITGTGTVNFTGETNLTAQLKSTASILGTATGLDNITVVGLVVENGLKDGSYALFEEGTGKFDITATNALYDFTAKDNGYIDIAKKSTSEVVASLTTEGATVQEAAALSAIAGTTSDSPLLAAISTAVQSGNVGEAVQAVKDLAPTTSQQVVGVTKDVVSMLSNVASDRINPVGLAGGDVFEGFGMWGQGLYNRSKQDATASSEGFRANTRGIAVGLDGKLSKVMTVGVGYGYTDTDADAGARDVDVEGHHVFLYGQYKPCAWYANWLLDYGYAKYDETKTPAGLSMKTSYNVHSYAAHYMTGYDFENGLMTEVGARYLLVDQDAYNDGLQRIKSDKNDTLTAVAGVKYQAVVKTDDVTFVPRLRLAATYDVKSEDSEANVQVVGGGNYQITGERLHRFGVEAGVGVTATVGAWDVSLDYFGGYRKDYQSHTGLLKAQYNF